MINSIQKGKRIEREWAKLCRDHGITAWRGQQYSGLGDADVVSDRPEFHFEVKGRERFELFPFLEQAQRDKKDDQMGVVCYKKNRKPWVVVMNAEDWFKLILSS